jgi:hypothetical protein
VLVVLAVVLALCVAAGVIIARSYANNAIQASTGDCLGNLPSLSVGERKPGQGGERVDCDDKNAVYRVESRAENKAEADVAGACPAEAPVAYWFATGDNKVTILCLKQLK